MKTERHCPTDVGMMIARMRQMATGRGEDELSEEAWSLLSEYLVIQEELDHACEEIRAAMGAGKQRRRRLAITIQSSNDQPHEADEQPREAANHGAPARHAHAVVAPAEFQLAQVVVSPPALRQLA